MSSDNEGTDHNRDFDRMIEPSIYAGLNGMDEQMVQDYMAYRRMEFELNCFLWARPELIPLVMMVNRNGTFCQPAPSFRGAGVPVEETDELLKHCQDKEEPR